MVSESELQVEREEVFLLLFSERGADFLLFFWVFNFCCNEHNWEISEM